MNLPEKDLGFQTSFLNYFPLPRTNVGPTFTRTVNGIQFTYFDMLGVPYSAVDRRWIEIVTTLAKLQAPDPRIEFGSVSQALARYGMARENNYILPARKALEKIARLHISSTQVGKVKGITAHRGLDFSFSLKHQIIWGRGRTDLVEPELFDHENFMELSPTFMKFVETAAPHVQAHYMSIRSPLTMDLYHWIITKLYGLREDELIRWPWLYAQFGQDGGILNESQMKDIRRLIKKGLLEIRMKYYPKARIEATDEGILLKRSPPLIASDSKRAGFSLL
jgi:hypothetical protein